jgi:hypothetical protein
MQTLIGTSARKWWTVETQEEKNPILCWLLMWFKINLHNLKAIESDYFIPIYKFKKLFHLLQLFINK